MFCLIVASSCTQSIPSNSTAYVIGSVLPEPRMIAETLMFQPTVCVPTGICSGACRLLTPSHRAPRVVAPCRGAARGAGSAEQSPPPTALAVLPQMLKLSDDLTATWFLELWLRAPSPAKAARLRVSAVERLLKQHRIRRVNAEGILRTLREPAIKVPDGVAAAAGVHIRSLIVRLQVVNRELNDAEHKLDELCTEERAEHRDVAILRSLPGIGRINLATLLSEASGPLSRRDYQALRTLSGVAPVTKRSGKSHVVVMRYASHVRLRNTVYHWARVATQHDHESRTRYAALRRRGHSHGRAIRGVADRLLAVACVLLQRQTLFDPHFRQAALS